MFWHHWFAIGSFMGAVSVGLGAFGAHALKGKLSPEHILIFETAVRYQMYHAMALFAVAFASTRIDNLAIKFSGACFTLGILLFSGSLHALIFIPEASRWAGPLTPIGGLLFLIGWILLGSGAFV
jgi:uncharacterized membrane protein YgdD (TMEM256/DUF423 family)